jgi:hypothetical protein
VGAPATLNSLALHCLERKTHDEGNTPGSTGTIAESHSGQVALRREQQENPSHENVKQSTALGKEGTVTH